MRFFRYRGRVVLVVILFLRVLLSYRLFALRNLFTSAGLPRVFSVPDDPKLRYSAVKGATIFQLDANAPSALAIGVLARGLWDLINAPKTTIEEAAAARVRQPAAAPK